MINYRFLHFTTKRAFEEKLRQIDPKSIVFIKDKQLIWTHDTYYGVVDEELNATSTNSVQNKAVSISINNLYNICSKNASDISSLTKAFNTDVDSTIDKFEAIADFLDRIQNTGNGQTILYDIIQSISTEVARATAAEEELSNRVNTLSNTVNSFSNSITDINNDIRDINRTIDSIQSGTQPSPTGGIKHVILTQTEYDAITEHDSNTLYYIVNPYTWTFGGTFPIHFGTISTLDGTFPITLT